MEFIGRVKKIFTKTGTKKDGSGSWTSTEIWVEETDGQYPQSAMFKLGKNAATPNEGEIVKIKFSMRTNEWLDPATQETRVFGENNAWSVESDRMDNEPIGQKPQAPQGNTESNPFPPQPESDKLPF